MIPNPSSDPLRRLNTPLVPEIKAEIGAALKAARLKKNQSLEAVSQQTRISKKFLEALEDNRFEEFPALAYLRGFLKSYCDFLELDFEAYWRAIQADAPAAPAAPGAPAHAAPAPAPAKSAPARASSPKTSHAAHSSHATHATTPEAPSDPAAVWRALFFAAVLAAAVGTLLSRGSVVAPKEAAAPPTSLMPLRQPTEPQLVIEFRQDAWISVAADGVGRFEGSVPRNSRQEWKAKKTLSLRTPNPEVLKLTLNGARYTLQAPDASGAYTIESP